MILIVRVIKIKIKKSILTVNQPNSLCQTMPKKTNKQKTVNPHIVAAFGCQNKGTDMEDTTVLAIEPNLQ